VAASRRPRVLDLARNYPSDVIPTLGLWTRRLVDASCRSADPTVIAPVPYAPPLLPIESFARFRRIARQRRDGAWTVYHPRVPLAPGYALHPLEAALAWLPVRRLADRLHAVHRFDLIHAHFIYPEGVMAARLGQRWGVPVVATEQSAWLPWFDQYPLVRRQVLRSLPQIRLVLPVSSWLQRNIAEAVGDRATTRVLPNVVDEATFTLADTDGAWDPNQLLFVGLIRRVKGLDLLVRAMALLAARRQGLRLLVVGGAFYRGYQRDEAEVRRLVTALGLEDRIQFAGQSSPAEVVAAMQRSALLVVPSRRETFSAVTAEAIASGTPVLATRCGGPEDIITPDNGRLVAPEDPDALARGIEEMLALRPRFDRRAMRAGVVGRFGMDVTASRIAAIYAEVLAT
jgi:teichuronic acid biosynthesis glycosyltransferase TuaC